MEGRIYIYIQGEKEGVEQERRKERKRVLKESKHNKNNNNKELLKKKERDRKSLLVSNWPSQFCWSFCL